VSTQTALDNINLVTSPRWGHTEYSLEYRGDSIARHRALAEQNPSLNRDPSNPFAFDFRWNTNDGLVNWGKTGRVTDMGHASYAADGSDQHDPVESPFKSMEEVWEFDAVEEYGMPDFNEQVTAFENQIVGARQNSPDQLTTGGYYRTIVSGAIASFGWDMLLMATSEPDKMEKVFDSFFRRTLFHMEAWAKTSAEVVIQHDDFVWTGGAFMNPEIYRKVIIPMYAKLWKPIHDAGKKVLFCSDGNFTEFAPDVAEAGADGFIFEPCVDFGYMVDTFGQSHCLVGSFVDCRDLTFSRWDKVEADIDKTFERLADCKGAILAVGNHLPPNIPDDMLDKYFERMLPKLSRKS
jgi:hypothetical protein